MINLKKEYNVIMEAALKQATELGSATLTAVIAIASLFFDIGLGLRLIFGIAFVMIISYMIKAVYFKSRPKKQSKATFIQRLDASSFPSVHSARITTIVFWLIAYFNSTYLTIFSLVIGLLVIYSRIYLRKHYWIDVIGGAAISIIVNVIIYHIL